MVPQISASWQRFLVQLGGAVLIIACLHLARAILLPLVVAVLLTFILNPVVGVLQKLRLGRVLSVLIAAGFTFASLAAVGWIFTQQLADLATELPKHKQNIVEKITALRGQEQQVLGTVMAFVQDVGDEIQKPPSKETAPEPVNVVLAETSNPWKLTWITIVVGPLLEDLIGAVFVVALVVLILISRENLRNRIFRLCGQGHLISTTKVLDSVADRISHYLLLQAVINVLFGALLGVGLFFLGVPYAPFFALIGAALRFVPYLGTSAVAAILLISEIAIFPGWTECLWSLLLLLVLELGTAYVAEPLLFGRHMGISPVALLMAAAFWSWLWGPVGLLLSTPMTVCLIVLGKNVANLGFLNVLLGDEPVLTDQFRFYQRLLARDQDEAAEVMENFLKKHNLEEAYDEILVPTLVLAKHDEADGQLGREHLSWMHAVIRETMDEFLTPSEEAETSSRVVVGYASRDETDELALEMLGQLLKARGVQLNALNSGALVCEVVAAVEEQEPAAVVIAALPTDGLAHSHYVCKKLRAACPGCTIVMGRWGLSERVAQIRQRALKEGANACDVKIVETAESIRPLPAKKHAEEAISA